MKLKIGAFTFSVRFVDDLRMEDGGRADGCLTHGKSEIRIDNSLSKQPMAQTLLHEVVHEMSIQTGINMKESMVDALAFGIYQVIRDNPELVKMINA